MTPIEMFAATLDKSARELRVMVMVGRGQWRDAGTAEEYFGDEMPLIMVGESRGADSLRGAYEWWPLTIEGEPAGWIADDAAGLTIHAGRNK